MASTAPDGSGFQHHHPRDRRFIALLVFVIWVAILTGFGLDMIQKAAAHRLTYPLLIHLHALTYGAWLVLLAAQVWLVRTNRVALHRQLGMAVLLLLPLMLILGPAAAISRDVANAAVKNDSLSFLSTQLTNVLGCVVLIAAGFLARGDAAAHKRLMLMRTIAITEPGFSRIWADPLSAWLDDRYVPYFISTCIGTVVLVLAVGAYDLMTRGRLHPAYIAAALWIFANEILASWLFYQPFWLAWMKVLTGH